MEDFPKPIRIKIFYEGGVEKIAKKDSEESIISEGSSFAQMLYFIFSSYPEIQKKFLPGTLGFLLNGKAPAADDILKDGDELKILGLKIEDIRRNIEHQVKEIINYYQIDTTFEEIKEMIFNENGKEDFDRLIGIFVGKISSGNPKEINEVLKFINAAWNYFPHKSLNGLSPIEKIKPIK